jgi:type I restriction enzyme, R subunit
MKYKHRLEPFLELDLVDSIAMSGYILLTKSGEKLYVVDYRRLMEQLILELVANHPTIIAIQQARADAASADAVRPYLVGWQLLELERTLTSELAQSDLEVKPENLEKGFDPSVDGFFDRLHQVLDMQFLPDYKDLVGSQFESYITQHDYNADQIRFLRAVQSLFFQKRCLETTGLYDSPVQIGVGQGEVEQWLTQKDGDQMAAFANQLEV